MVGLEVLGVFSYSGVIGQASASGLAAFLFCLNVRGSLRRRPRNRAKLLPELFDILEDVDILESADGECC